MATKQWSRWNAGLNRCTLKSLSGFRAYLAGDILHQRALQVQG